MGKAHLRISYLGGGYDFPKFFEYHPVTILSEALPIGVICDVSRTDAQWHIPRALGSGLGSSAAKHLSFIRAKFPSVPWREQIDTAIQLEALQAGGWQDPVASAYQGLLKIVLYQNDWQVYPITDSRFTLRPYRQLYQIPVARTKKDILIGMQCRESSYAKMQSLVEQGLTALQHADVERFGDIVKTAWHIKKQWHPDITNETITGMETVAENAGAWGWKCCGAGGQGYLLVIGDAKCHEQMREEYTTFEVDGET